MDDKEKNVEEVKEETLKKDDELANSPKKGGNKAVVIIMGVIIVALLIVILFLLLGGKDKNTEKDNSEKDQKTENEPTPNKPEIKVIELDFAGVPCGSVDFTIGKGTVEVGNISAHDKLGMLATALLKLIGEEKLKNLTTEKALELDFDILEEAKKYFDVDAEMEKLIKEGFGTDFYLFSQKNNKATLELIIGGCIGPHNQGYYVKEKDRKIDNDTLIKSYYYYYVKNADDPVVIGNDNGYDITTFASSYYKEKEDANPVYKDIISEDAINYDSFNTFDVYYKIINGETKLTKVVFNTK